MGSKSMIIFDFDETISELDSDRFVFEVLQLPLRRELEDRLNSGENWQDCLDSGFEKLHSLGFVKDCIEGINRSIPMHPSMIRALLHLRSTYPDTIIILLSNGNTEILGCILEHYGLTNVFNRIITNPAHWDESGRLRVDRRIPASSPNQHTCDVGCKPNMCKGDELEALIKENGGEAEFSKVIYVGDGSNDYCPCLRLRPQDRILGKAHKPLQRRMDKEGYPNAEVTWWSDAWKLEEIFRNEKLF